ncbi:DUF4337 domain-containing protein [Sphingomonas sp. RB3P16]|uniref:DUF4337 domain-containing protein n=1 Tax=Parasphingomonas frigoris TaxID=3096163 RepID=UPI002FCAC27A
MEIEVSAEAKDKRLNRMVAITVVALSVFMGLGNIKDGNIVQNMAQAKADSVDRWGEYQATKTKIHIAQTARAEMTVIATTPAAHAAATVAIAGFDRDIVRYSAEVPALAKQAQAFADRYDAYNVHDDQFDASEALIATAISMAAVAALAESFWLLAAGWAFGLCGIFMGVCGFAGWGFHPDVLSTFLG